MKSRRPSPWPWAPLLGLLAALLLPVAGAAQESDTVHCLASEKAAVQETVSRDETRRKKQRPPEYVRGFKIYLSLRTKDVTDRVAGQEDQWQSVAACMCLAQDSWPQEEDPDIARLYDRWFIDYLPRYYLGLALYQLGCYSVALEQLQGIHLDSLGSNSDEAEDLATLKGAFPDIQHEEPSAGCFLWQSSAALGRAALRTLCESKKD